MNNALSAQRNRRQELSLQKGLVQQMLDAGSRKAEAVANRTLDRVRSAMKLKSFSH